MGASLRNAAPSVETPAAHADRRQALRLAVAAAALGLVAGCRLFGGSGSELDRARADLEKLLEEAAADDVEEVRLLSIARRMSATTAELKDEHAASLDGFDRLSRLRDVTSADLRAYMASFEGRRTHLRSDLFRLADELRTALGPEDWERALDILARGRRDVARSPFGES